MNKTCKQCGVVFYKQATHSQQYWSTRTFCSNRCKVYSNQLFYKYWTHKARPTLRQTRAKVTMFKKQQPPWNKGRVTPPDLMRRKYSAYKANAKKRGLPFQIGYDAFQKYLTGSCSYCFEPSTGIDRVDNTKGYIIGNMTSCCAGCNRMKGTLTTDAFYLKCAAITKKAQSALAVAG